MYDVLVIGGGIVGLAVARALNLESRTSIAVVEAESGLATHQSGHNSGVIHAGLYYRPGSSKAQHCIAGREALYRLCEERGIPFRRCGKVVVATSARELSRLELLERRGVENGLRQLRRLGPEELHEREPHARGVAALWVPQTGVVDFSKVAAALAEQFRQRGGDIVTSARVDSVQRRSSGFVVRAGDRELESRCLVNCAGLQSDRVARLCGARPLVRIVPFRGEYQALRPERASLVRGLIYPVPDSRFPFLGVHFTRRVDDRVELGPNAILALRREGYRRGSFSARDVWSTWTYPGFWRFAARHWRTGVEEHLRSWRASRFVTSARRLVPDLQASDLEPCGAGVRAQAISRDGKLVDDFHVLEAERTLHVLNAPSPAATACLAIGATLARRAIELFGLTERGQV